MTPDPDRSTSPEWLIDRYLDELLTPEQGVALNAWVKADAANARHFAKAAWLHRQVYNRLHMHDLGQLQMGAGSDAEVGTGWGPDEGSGVLARLLELEQEVDAPGLVDLTQELRRRDLDRRRGSGASLPRAGDSSAVRVLVIPRLLAYGSIAAVVLGLLSVVYVVSVDHRPVVGETVVENPPAHAVPDAVPSLPPVVAELVRSDGLVWDDPDLSTRPGTVLRQGLVTLDAGVACIRFQRDAVATFRGPAVIDLRGDNHLALFEGAMVANVPEQAYGFTVDTPSMRVVDLGTEFGITAEASGDSTVQVFVGEVTAAAFDATGRPGNAIPLTSRMGVAVDAQARDGQLIEVDGRAFADLAPHVALLHRNLVVNGDFEQGEPGVVTSERLSDAENVEVYGWEDHGAGTVLRYEDAAAFDYPDPAIHPMPEGRGQSYYLGMTQSTIRQRIDVADLAALIDADAIRFDLAAWLGGFEHNDEYIQLSLRFLNARDLVIDVPHLLEPVRADDRQDVSGFLHRSAQGPVPAGARSILIELENFGAPRHTGNVWDGYADNVSLVLSAE